jgi:hypothetical protein
MNILSHLLQEMIFLGSGSYSTPLLARHTFILFDSCVMVVVDCFIISPGGEGEKAGFRALSSGNTEYRWEVWWRWVGEEEDMTGMSGGWWKSRRRRRKK